jgi:HSP20 family molecular chaperone IbpA
VDVLETENDLIFKADAAGVNLKDIDIQLEGNSNAQRGAEVREGRQGEGLSSH